MERNSRRSGLAQIKEKAIRLVSQRFNVTQQGRFGDQHMYASLTRFISPSVARAFDVVAPTTGASQAIMAEDALPALDLLDRFRTMWR